MLAEISSSAHTLCTCVVDIPMTRKSKAASPKAAYVCIKIACETPSVLSYRVLQILPSLPSSSLAKRKKLKLREKNAKEKRKSLTHIICRSKVLKFF